MNEIPRRLHQDIRPSYLICTLLLLLSVCPLTTSAANLPEGFAEKRVAAGLQGATAMAFAPDGRLFVCQQSGQLRIIKDGELLPEPFLSVPTDTTGERGLLGVALDPHFATNGYVYVYYTVLAVPRHNRVSRFKADGDRAAPGSETVIFRLDDLSSAAIHNGGAMHFGPDGKLYVAVGENDTPSNAQSLDSLMGKMLRLNPDGSIPDDNPFNNVATGNRRAIWARGLRNPFTFAFSPGSSQLFINDVGENEWEEINEGAAGANYGWPAAEGPTDDPAYRSPLYAYPHAGDAVTICAVTGGTFYAPPAAQFPARFEGKYFFADFCGGWIRVLDPATKEVELFATGVPLPVDLQIAPDGTLYYLSRGADAVFQVTYTGTQAPFISSQPSSLTVSVGQTATFTVGASGGQPLSYQWQRNGLNIDGANSPTLTVLSAALADSGARFRCVVSNSFGSVTSAEAVLTVTADAPPAGNILLPADAALYSAGETISYSGEARDAEDGELPPSAFTWRVDFHHEDHAHPFLAPHTGARSGSFVVPTRGEKSPDVWFRIHLRVTDSAGRSHESFRDVRPRLANVTLATEPAGLQVTLDGQPLLAPATFRGVAGLVRQIGVAPAQSLNGVAYEFKGWSDSGAAMHDIETPSADATLTAVFAPAAAPPPAAVRLGAPSYSVNEVNGRLTVTVTREGDASAPLTVDYATSGGTASERSDYLTALGTLTFAPGETSRTIELLFTNDVLDEAPETLTIALSNLSGPAALGAPSLATVTIVDDDEPQPSRNPIEDDSFFVRQHYLDFLNREPDQDGLKFWVGQMTNCGDADLEVCRVNVSAAFFLSIEFQETGFLAYRLEVAAFRRFPRFREWLRDARSVGEGVIVGQGDWRARLEARKRAHVAAFVTRPEFLSEFPASLTAAQFVDKLNAQAGLPLSATERAGLVTRLASGEIDRAQALAAVVEDEDFVRGELNRAFLLMEYFGYARRNPDDPPDNDLSGYQFWLNKLNQFNGNYINAEMVKAFLVSGEYRERFGPR